MVKFLKILLIALLFFICFFLLILSISFFVQYIKNKKKYKHRIACDLLDFKDTSLIHKIFIEFPKAFFRDWFTLDPNIFDVYGLNLITGKQGCGKSITMSYLMRKYRYIYPKLKICANFDSKFADKRINSYVDIVDNKNANGIYGEMDCIQELQTWFSALQSKNFPDNFLSTITQQRHVRRAIFADTQVFSRVAKPLRENTYRIFCPHTYFNCFTWVTVYEPSLDADATVTAMRKIDSFCFVHDDELRNSFDSYDKSNI